MNLLSDFFKYFVAVVTGKRDPLTAFLEPLTMAERYLRWGREKGDIRDFRSGLEQLMLCVDDEAPIPNLLLRKYTTLSDLAAGGVERLLGNFETLKRESEQRREDVGFDKVNQEEALAEIRARVEALKKEGALLRAREEEKKIAEGEARLEFLKEKAEEADNLDELCDHYDQMAYDATRFFMFFDQGTAALPHCKKIPEAMRESLIQQLRTRSESLRERLDKADPIPEERASPAGAKPTPAPAPGGRR